MIELTYKGMTQEQKDREVELLAECGRLFNGYSKHFRETFAQLVMPERLYWLEHVAKEGRGEAIWEGEDGTEAYRFTGSRSE